MSNLLTRSTTSSAVVYASIAAVRRILSMAITVPTAHIFGPFFYGQLNIATTWMFLLSTVFALGLEVIVFRAAASRDAESLAAVGWLLRLATPCVGALLAGVVVLAKVHFSGLSTLIIALVLVTAAFTPSNSAFFNAVTRSQGDIGRFVTRNLVLLIVGTALKAVFILALHGGLTTWLLIELAVAIGGWVYSLAVSPLRPLPIPPLAGVLRTSLPLLPHTLMHWIVGTSDRLLIAAMLGVKEVAVYAATYTIPSFLSVALGELNSAFMASYARNPDPKSYTEQAVKQSRLFGAVTLVAAMLGAPLTTLVFPEALTTSVWLIPILCAGYMAFAIYLIAANILTLAAKVTHTMLILSSTGAAVNFLANLLVIGRFGLLGAACTTLFGYCSMVAVGGWKLGKLGKAMPWRALLGRGLLIPWGALMVCVGTWTVHVY